MSYLVIDVSDPDNWTYIEWQRNGIESTVLFKSLCKIGRAIRRFHIKLNLPWKSIWLGEWKKNIINTDVIVLHISSLSLWVPKFINKINPNTRVIAWYWNSVTSAINPSRIQGKCEMWSFDITDCKKYGMHFNHQYYFKSLVMKDVIIDNDVFFCGSDSGRGELLSRIYEQLKKRGVKADFRIVYPEYTEIPQEIISDRLSYSEIINGIGSCRAILELVRNGQSGPTLRLMEAVFQGKKLITNNIHVLEEPFYDSSKIFLLKNDNWDELVDFLYAPYEAYDEELLDRYDVSNWLREFGITI